MPRKQGPGYFAANTVSKHGGISIAGNVPVQRLFRIRVQCAEKYLQTTAVPTANIAPKSVITKGSCMMDRNTFHALTGYKSAMAQARLMRCKGLITDAEYSIIETKMCGIFGINFGSLYRDNDWINGGTDGNIASAKEVL